MSGLSGDLKHATRVLRNSPGFTLTAVLALAIGIGANSAIFSVVNGVLLRPLPFRDADRLVMVYEGIPHAGLSKITFSPPDYEAFAHRAQSYSGLAVYVNRQFELSGIEQPERVKAARISASLFPVLGVNPVIGTMFSEEDDRAARPSAVLSYSLWQRKFGGDPAIIGKPVVLDRKAYTVVAVAAKDFVFPPRGPQFNNEPADVYIPISFTPEERAGFGNRFNHSVIGRLKPGVSVEQASAEANAILARLIKEVYPAQLRDLTLTGMAAPLRDEIVGRVQKSLMVLLAAVGMVLLIGCADVANLLLTRATGRQKEMAIRAALGASRWQLGRQVLAESLILAAAGGVLGLVLSFWATELLLQLAPADLPRVEDVQVSGTVLLFTLMISLVTAVVFGAVPALEGGRVDLQDALKDGSRSTTPGRRRGRLLRGMVALQFALALVLLVGAGLLMRSFLHLLSTDPGFRPDHVLTLSTSLPVNSYLKSAQIRSFYRQLMERVSTLPGVKVAAAATNLPMSISEQKTFALEGESPATVNLPHTVVHVWAMGNYFEALGVPLKAGRFLQPGDGEQGERVVVVNETLAKRFFPGKSVAEAVGRRLKWGIANNSAPWERIVGVVGDIKHGPLQSEVEPETFEPYLQEEAGTIEDQVSGGMRAMSIIVRTGGDPTALAQAVRSEVRTLDASLPVTDVQTMEQVVRGTTGPQRFQLGLIAAFAGCALLLAAMGIYGVLAYTVTQRTHEFGVRLALGADRGDVMQMVLRQGMSVAGAGAVAGLAISFAVNRVLGSLLYGVSPYDGWTIAGVTAVLGLVALLATYLPARRATRVDPVIALRFE